MANDDRPFYVCPLCEDDADLTTAARYHAHQRDVHGSPYVEDDTTEYGKMDAIVVRHLGLYEGVASDPDGDAATVEVDRDGHEHGDAWVTIWLYDHDQYAEEEGMCYAVAMADLTVAQAKALYERLGAAIAEAERQPR